MSHDTHSKGLVHHRFMYTFSPSWAYSLSCMRSNIVGTEFPLPSYVHCIDSAETPKTLALKKTKENELDEFTNRGLMGLTGKSWGIIPTQIQTCYM